MSNKRLDLSRSSATSGQIPFVLVLYLSPSSIQPPNMALCSLPSFRFILHSANAFGPYLDKSSGS